VRVEADRPTGEFRAGLLDALARGVVPVDAETLDAALGRMPASAYEVSAVRLAPGRTVRAVDRLVRTRIPELAGALDLLEARIESATGVPILEELAGLEPLTLCGFAARTPVGGAPTDSLVLARTDRLDAYWRIGEGLFGALGATRRELDRAGRTIVSLELPTAPSAAAVAEAFVAVLLGRDEVSAPSVASVALASAVRHAFGGVTRVDLGDGWSVLSRRPSSVVRYLDLWAAAPSLADDELAALARERLAGASRSVAGTVFRSGPGALTVYNRLLETAYGIAPGLRRLGVEPQRLPAGGAFLADRRGPHDVGSALGYLRLRVDETAWSLDGHRALESATGVAVATSGAAVATAVGVAPAADDGAVTAAASRDASR